MMEPYPWQDPLWKAVAAGIKRDRFFISGFPTGSGKTVISLAAARALGNPHLVVAPKVALTQWRRTAEEMGCAGQLVDVINPEKVSKPSGCGYYTRDGKWRLPENTTVIWDEPHRSASGIKSVTTQALAELKGYKSISLHAMSATLADSPLKLRALGWWAGMHKYNEDSFFRWCRDHGCRTEYVGMDRRPAFRFTKDPVEARKIMAKIRADFGNRFMSLRAEDIPGFPTETVDVKLIDLSERDTREINAAHAEMSDRMKSRARSDMAELGRARERVEFIMSAAVAELSCSYAESGHSVVVFFNFTAPRERFEALVSKAGFGFAGIYGGQKDSDRQKGINDFQSNKTKIISVMTEAGGAALSLHDERKESPRVSLILPSWNSSTVKQCLGRIRRCNGTHATQYFVLAVGTIQERVAVSLKRKLGNIDALNDGDLEFPEGK